jgi:hypothetical protein
MTSKWFQRWFGPAPKEMPDSITIEVPHSSNLVVHAQRELTLAGLFDTDSDYDGAAGQAVLDLVKVFASQRHSGFSAMLVLDLFDRVAHFKPLGALTDNPDEWIEVGPSVWQNRRHSSCFSEDGGKTYYDIDEPMTGDEHPVHNSKEYISG